MSVRCLILSDDLLDSSRVVGEARALDMPAMHCRLPASLIQAIAQGPAPLVIVDLHYPGIDIEALIPRVREQGGRLVGYGAHVDAARFRQARQLGCNEVLPRSAFFEELGKSLQEWANSVRTKENAD